MHSLNTSTESLGHVWVLCNKCQTNVLFVLRINCKEGLVCVEEFLFGVTATTAKMYGGEHAKMTIDELDLSLRRQFVPNLTALSCEYLLVFET